MRTLAPATHQFDSRDPDDIHQHLATTYGTRLRLRARDGDYRLTHRRTDLGPVRLDDLSQSTDLAVGIDGLDTLVVCEPLTGEVNRTCDGEAVRYLPGDVHVVTRPHQPCTVDWRPGRVALCVLDLALLTEVSGEDGTADALRTAGLGAVPPDLARHWRTTTAYVRRALLSEPDALGSPLVIGATARLLAASALALCGAIPPSTTRRDTADAGDATLRRAIGYLEEHAHLDVSVAQVAAAARVSPRALQLAFRRHLDTTPMAYLRDIRLRRAHRELQVADPGRETVAGIALRWGFLSHSRFTARYRATFGVAPRRTLYG
ncbi:AraC family transcriptional regulator [Micromonospora sp. NPDC050495]|uniref:AraC family transcriptional regulator n=1 Tax=Micromonospora sp. NPDC050495 TaxID=3154936 RepID=UPI0033D49552